MAGSLGDLGGLLRQAQKVQRQMAELQEELKKQSFEGTAGGGAVTARVSGAKELLEVRIRPEAVEAGDVEMLEDLVTTAVRNALNEAETQTSKKMKELTGGLGLPGMPGGL